MARTVWSLGMKCRIGLVTALLSSLTFAVPAAAQSPPYNPETELDHYLCYVITDPKVIQNPIPLQIIDQFSVSPPARAAVSGRDLLCNPVSKNGGAVHYPKVHLLCYDIARVAQPFTRHVANQFASERALEVQTANEAFLCLPTGKTKDLNVRPGDPERPRAVDHFKCYTMQQAPAVNGRVTLGDEFNRYLVRKVLDPKLLCNPAEKVINGKQYGPMLHNRAHLVCYRFGPARGNVGHIPVRIHNQFDADLQLTVISVPSYLCVPSTKSAWRSPTRPAGRPVAVTAAA
jgi:hypothetical protein